MQKVREQNVGRFVDRLSLKAIRRLIVAVIGTTVILLGIILALPMVPGPGFVAILAGLAILATEFLWARRLLRRVRARMRAAVNSVRGKNGARAILPAEAAPAENARTDHALADHTVADDAIADDARTDAAGDSAAPFLGVAASNPPADARARSAPPMPTDRAG